MENLSYFDNFMNEFIFLLNLESQILSYFININENEKFCEKIYDKENLIYMGSNFVYRITARPPLIYYNQINAFEIALTQSTSDNIFDDNRKDILVELVSTKEEITSIIDKIIDFFFENKINPL
jgi:hypothetical protein